MMYDQYLEKLANRYAGAALGALGGGVAGGAAGGVVGGLGGGRAARRSVFKGMAEERGKPRAWRRAKWRRLMAKKHPKELGAYEFLGTSLGALAGVPLGSAVGAVGGGILGYRAGKKLGKRKRAEQQTQAAENQKKTAEAWTRKEGQNPTGGLNAKGRASLRAKGQDIKAPVTTKPSKLKKGSKAANRRKSFCARMGGMPGPMKDEKGRPTRKALSLRKWNC
jgi:uncharacterized membrane protein